MSSQYLPSNTPDDKLLDLTFKLSSTIPLPSQSLFRVFSIITFRDHKTPKDKISYITGTNCECCFLANSICAERSALTQLRHLPGSKVLGIYIICSSEEYITPGMLCREFMFNHYCDKNTPIITCGTNKKARKFSLGELYPFPHIYLNTNRDNVIPFAKQFAKKATSPLHHFTEPTWQSLYNQVTTKASHGDTTLHPITYGAGVLFKNGDILCVLPHNSLEYGCSLDAVSRLGPFLEKERDFGNEPVLILQVDQFGNLHAPFSVARAYLFENKFYKVLVGVHVEDGGIRVERVEVLVPHGIKVDEVFKPAKL